MSVKNRFEIRFNIRFHLKVLSQNPIIVVSPYVLSLPLLCSTQVSMAMQAHWSTVSQGLTLYNSQTNIDSRYTLCMSVYLYLNLHLNINIYMDRQLFTFFSHIFIHMYTYLYLQIYIDTHSSFSHFLSLHHFRTSS